MSRYKPGSLISVMFWNPVAEAGIDALTPAHRAALTAEFSCERENAQSPCLPLRPMTLRFNAPVPRDVALAIRLQPEKGAAIAPTPERGERQAQLNEVRFLAPLPESTKFRIVLPAGLKDDSGQIGRASCRERVSSPV